MAILLFKLNNVPDDEAMDIRELLEANDIYFYETHAGMWRLGLDAIWLTDNTNEEKARELIKGYQAERSANEQKNYAELVESGQAPTLWQNFCHSPLRFVALIVAVIFVLSLTLAPFGMMLKH
jgi:hypothetical protein